MLEEERVQLQGDLTSVKADAKKRIQRRFGLEENPKARLFVSLGRLVRQKGVDLIADVADWLLSNFANAQLIFVGPVGDGFGQYAANKLEALKEHGRHDGRLHLHMQFLSLPKFNISSPSFSHIAICIFLRIRNSEKTYLGLFGHLLSGFIFEWSQFDDLS